jgi:hypothetical protein
LNDDAVVVFFIMLCAGYSLCARLFSRLILVDASSHMHLFRFEFSSSALSIDNSFTLLIMNSAHANSLVSVIIERIRISTFVSVWSLAGSRHSTQTHSKKPTQKS